MRLSRELRVVATCDGAIVSTFKGCFRLDGASANSLLPEVVPTLYINDGQQPPDTVCALKGQLLDAGIIESSVEEETDTRTLAGFSRVAISRATPFAQRTIALLASAGFESGTHIREGDFVVSDLSDLTDEDHSV